MAVDSMVRALAFEAGRRCSKPASVSFLRNFQLLFACFHFSGCVPNFSWAFFLAKYIQPYKNFQKRSSSQLVTDTSNDNRNCYCNIECSGCDALLENIISKNAL